MDAEKMLGIANQVTDEIIEEIDTFYKDLEKRQGVYEITGEEKATWVRRLTVLFESDGFDVKQLDESHITVA